MAKLRYAWDSVESGDIISFRYNKKRRTVLVISPKYMLNKVDKTRVELMSGLQLETQERRASPNMITILKQLGKLTLIDTEREIYRINFDGRKLDADKRRISNSVKELVSETNDLYRTYDYKEAKKSSVFLEPIVLPNALVEVLIEN